MKSKIYNWDTEIMDNVLEFQNYYTHTKHLDKNHTCFGKVVEGLEIIDKLKQGDKFSIITE